VLNYGLRLKQVAISGDSRMKTLGGLTHPGTHPPLTTPTGCNNTIYECLHRFLCKILEMHRNSQLRPVTADGVSSLAPTRVFPRSLVKRNKSFICSLSPMLLRCKCFGSRTTATRTTPQLPPRSIVAQDKCYLWNRQLDNCRSAAKTYCVLCVYFY